MLYYHTCTPPQDIYDIPVQTFYGLARVFGLWWDRKKHKKSRLPK